jgi:hypothetical protein
MTAQTLQQPLHSQQVPLAQCGKYFWVAQTSDQVIHGMTQYSVIVVHHAWRPSWSRPFTSTVAAGSS